MRFSMGEHADDAPAATMESPRAAAGLGNDRPSGVATTPLPDDDDARRVGAAPRLQRSAIAASVTSAVANGDRGVHDWAVWGLHFVNRGPSTARCTSTIEFWSTSGESGKGFVQALTCARGNNRGSSKPTLPRH